MSYGHLRTLMIIQGWEAFLLEEIPGILNIGADREPVAGEITIRQPQVLQRLAWQIQPDTWRREQHRSLGVRRAVIAKWRFRYFPGLT